MFLKSCIVFRTFLAGCLCFVVLSAFSQDNLYAGYTTIKAREKLYKNLNLSINKSLALPLTDSAEEKWQEAFWALELLQFTSPRIDKKITAAFDSAMYRSDGFKKALIELAYTNYPVKYNHQISWIMKEASNVKMFAMSAEYLLRSKQDDSLFNLINQLISQNFPNDQAHPILVMLRQKMASLLSADKKILTAKQLNQILNKNFLPGQVIMYSFQRKNRDYPGLVIVRNGNGEFVRDSSNRIFAVPQLARSITNLPSYITNGNTPQGIFKLKGFDVSINTFIGPTPNIQMLMPVEDSLPHFFNDSSITDTVWSIEKYAQLLPKSLRDFMPLYESYYAGAAGRTEIIAHGTTINPEYYAAKTYYPFTPSLGCLCTKEIWNGKRIFSDQLKLVKAMLSAGGANGYCVVIELNDDEKPVAFEDIAPMALKAELSK